MKVEKEMIVPIDAVEGRISNPLFTGPRGVIRLKVQDADCREKMITALAGSGYKVWVEKEMEEGSLYSARFFVCFELGQ